MITSGYLNISDNVTGQVDVVHQEVQTHNHQSLSGDLK